MSIEDPNIIDFCSIDKEGRVILTISDHLEWVDPKQHLSILQSKLNAYLSAIESGQLIKSYPNATDKKIAINLVMKYWPNSGGHQYLERVKNFLKENGYDFSYKKLVVDD